MREFPKFIVIPSNSLIKDKFLLYNFSIPFLNLSENSKTLWQFGQDIFSPKGTFSVLFEKVIFDKHLGHITFTEYFLQWLQLTAFPRMHSFSFELINLLQFQHLKKLKCFLQLGHSIIWPKLKKLSLSKILIKQKGHWKLASKVLQTLHVYFFPSLSS